MMEQRQSQAKGKISILIVDDEPVQLVSLRRGLRTRGFATAEAGSVEEALSLLAGGNDFDLLITDYAMPGRNGVDLIAALRECDLDLPVLMMTAHGEKSLVREALEMGCTGYLEKPFTLEKLLSEIHEVMGPGQDPGGDTR